MGTGPGPRSRLNPGCSREMHASGPVCVRGSRSQRTPEACDPRLAASITGARQAAMQA